MTSVSVLSDRKEHLSYRRNGETEISFPAQAEEKISFSGRNDDFFEMT